MKRTNRLKNLSNIIKENLLYLVIMGGAILAGTYFYNRSSAKVVFDPIAASICQVEYPLDQILDQNLMQHLSKIQLKQLNSFYSSISSRYSKSNLVSIINSAASKMIYDSVGTISVNALTYPQPSLKGGGKGSASGTGAIGISPRLGVTPRPDTLSPRVSLSPRLPSRSVLVTSHAQQNPTGESSRPSTSLVSPVHAKDWHAPSPRSSRGQQSFPRDVTTQAKAKVDIDSFALNPSDLNNLPAQGKILKLEFKYSGTKNADNIVTINVKFTPRQNKIYFEIIDQFYYTRGNSIYRPACNFFKKKGYLPEGVPLVVQVETKDYPNQSGSNSDIVPQFKYVKTVNGKASKPLIVSVNNIEKVPDGTCIGIARDAQDDCIFVEKRLQAEHPLNAHSRASAAVPQNSLSILMSDDLNMMRTQKKFFQFDVKFLFDKNVVNKTFGQVIFDMQEANRNLVLKESEARAQYMQHSSIKTGQPNAMTDICKEYGRVNAVQTQTLTRHAPQDFFDKIKQEDEAVAMFLRHQLHRISTLIERAGTIHYDLDPSHTVVPQLGNAIKKRITILTKISTSCRIYFGQLVSGKVVISKLFVQMNQLEGRMIKQCERIITSYGDAAKLNRLPPCLVLTSTSDIQAAENIVSDYKKIFNLQNDLGTTLTLENMTIYLTRAQAQEFIHNMANHECLTDPTINLPTDADNLTTDAEKIKFLEESESTTFATLGTRLPEDLLKETFTLLDGKRKEQIKEIFQDLQLKSNMNSQPAGSGSTPTPGSGSQPTPGSGSQPNPSKKGSDSQLTSPSLQANLSSPLKADVTTRLRIQKRQSLDSESFIKSHPIELKPNEITVETDASQSGLSRSSGTVPKLKLQELSK